MNLLKEMTLFEDLVDEEQKKLKEEDPLDAALDDYDGDEETKTAFTVLRDLMATYKAYCDECEQSWKRQEIPIAVRRKLMSLDQNNQEQYQNLYMLIDKYKNDMMKTEIKDGD